MIPTTIGFVFGSDNSKKMFQFKIIPFQARKRFNVIT